MISYGVAGMVITLSERGVKLFECGVVYVCINEGLFECRDGNGDNVLTERRSDMVIRFKIATRGNLERASVITFVRRRS